MRTVTIPRSRVFHGPLAVVNRSHPLRGDIPTDLAAPDDRYPDILMEDVYKRQMVSSAGVTRQGFVICSICGPAADFFTQGGPRPSASRIT